VINTLAQQRRDPLQTSLDDPSSAPAAALGRVDPAFSNLAVRDRVTKAIERLPAHYQVLINAHYLKGVQYEDLAAAMDIPLGTLKTHLHRAKKMLRQVLESELR